LYLLRRRWIKQYTVPEENIDSKQQAN